MIDLRILDPRVGTDWLPLPCYAKTGDAGMDLRALLDEPVTIYPGCSKTIGTGIAIHIKHPNKVGLIFPRSGLGANHGIVLGNLTGVIDSGYQGEIKINLWNHGCKPYTVEPGERIAQIIFLPIHRETFSIVDEFSNSERGESGFGDSGRN